MGNGIRVAAVAGAFYPSDANELRREVTGLLREPLSRGEVPRAPKAVIVPHAGYEFSGPIAASAYARLQVARGTIRRVVLVGPAHRVRVVGLAASEAAAFATPLGEVPLDREAVLELLRLPSVHLSGFAHAHEHSLEVQIPFLQMMLTDFTIVPLVVNDAEPAEVAGALDTVWGGPETLVVVSSDLSHYHTYEVAVKRDAATAEAILHEHWDVLGPEDACGYAAVNGLLYVAAERGLEVQLVDLRNSGDTSGGRSEVVGYGAFALCE